MPDVGVLTARPHRLLPAVIQKIGELHQRGKPCILLVPEQFTLQAERELIKRLRLPGLISIQVLSPTRLKNRVMEAAGADERVLLSAAGQQMAVQLAMESCADRLKFYRASINRRGFAQKLLALITDMKRGGLEPEALRDYATGLPEGMRREKFTDLGLLYAAYRETLEGRLGDSDDVNLFITRRLMESAVVSGQNVLTYGFDAMSEQLIVLLCAIAEACDSLTVGLESDGSGAGDQAIYLPIRQSVARFRAALEGKGLRLTETALPPKALGHAPAIDHLDAMLFAYPQKRFELEQNSVFLTQFNSPFEEATHAARQILRLNRDGTNLERIALFYPGQNGYPFAVAAALEDSGLPFYTDDKLPALSHGLVQFILAALRAMADGFRNEDVFAMLKSGYASLTFDEACTLESYAREYGVNGGRWLKPFQKGDYDARAAAEALRQKAMLPLTDARDRLASAKNASDSLGAVMGLLDHVRAYDQLKREEDALLEENLLVRAGQNSQIWQTILDLLDQLYLLSGEKRIPLRHIADRFEAGVSAVTLGALPPAAGMLHAGVLGHSLSGEADAVFLLGMNDGILSGGAESLLTDAERLQAQENTKAYLGMTEESRLAFARLDLKRAMTLPRRTLYLSYAKTDPAGNALQPLDLAGDMEDNLFYSIPEASEADDDLPVSSGQAMTALSDLLRRYADGDEAKLPEIWKERLAKLLFSAKTAAPALRLLHAAGFRVEALPLDAQAAQRLFGDRTMSVSRLEEFAACPFRHYVTYGLLPEERKDWEVTPIERGNFFHDSLQRFAQLASGNARYPDITPDEVAAMADQASAPLEEALKDGPMGDGPRSLASLAQAKRVVLRACAAVTDHLAAGKFRLEKAEANFGFPGADSFPPVTLRLSDGTELSLHGRIDRIDSYSGGDAVYRRVVDYKSGPYAVLDGAELWHGLQLQLMLYLDAVTRSAGTAKPAGAFYFHLFDPMAKADADAQTAAADIRKQLQMNGLALADDKVLAAMDAGEGAVAIPAAVTKSGELRKGAKALDEARLNALMDHTRGKARQFAQSMLDGEISVRPVVHGAKTSCDYCQYRSICGYDPLARGAKSTQIYSMSVEELSARLENKSET